MKIEWFIFLDNFLQLKISGSGSSQIDPSLLVVRAAAPAALLRCSCGHWTCHWIVHHHAHFHNCVGAVLSASSSSFLSFPFVVAVVDLAAVPLHVGQSLHKKAPVPSGVRVYFFRQHPQCHDRKIDDNPAVAKEEQH